MKKLILLVSIFLASGCSKTLTCTNESKDNNSTQKSEVIIKFDGDKPTEMKTNIIFKTDSEETFNTYKKKNTIFTLYFSLSLHLYDSFILNFSILQLINL